MKKLLTLALALAVLAVLTGPAVAQQSWSVAIEQNPMLTNCGNTMNIPVAGANSCATAITAAWTLLNTLLAIPNCMGPSCPAGSTMTQGVPSCTPDPYTRPNGSPAIRYQVSLKWNCVQPCKDITMNLSTGQNPQWTVNSGPAYSTAPLPSSWLTPSGGVNWIQPVNSPAPQLLPSGNYQYRVPFTLLNPALYSSIQVTGSYAADNKATLSMNTITCPGCSCQPTLFVNCFSSWHPFTITQTSAIPSSNTLDVTVYNNPTGGTPPGPTYTGLVVNATLRAVCKKKIWYPTE